MNIFQPSFWGAFLPICAQWSLQKQTQGNPYEISETACATISFPIVCPDSSSNLTFLISNMYFCNSATLQCSVWDPPLGTRVRKGPPGIKLGNLRSTSLISLLSEVKTLHYIFSYPKQVPHVFCSVLKVIYGGKGSLDPVAPSWPEADICSQYVFVCFWSTKILIS